MCSSRAAARANVLAALCLSTGRAPAQTTTHTNSAEFKIHARAARRGSVSIIKLREIDQLKARLAANEAALSKLTNTK